MYWNGKSEGNEMKRKQNELEWNEKKERKEK